ncbi:MAG TPA: hypothetical protein VI298_17320 [Geobacteraceae bacterium]
MAAGILAFIAIFGSFFLFGYAGIRIGMRLDRARTTRNADAAFFWIFGFAGTCLVLFVLHIAGFW